MSKPSVRHRNPESTKAMKLIKTIQELCQYEENFPSINDTSNQEIILNAITAKKKELQDEMDKICKILQSKKTIVTPQITNSYYALPVNHVNASMSITQPTTYPLSTRSPCLKYQPTTLDTMILMRT